MNGEAGDYLPIQLYGRAIELPAIIWLTLYSPRTCVYVTGLWGSQRAVLNHTELSEEKHVMKLWYLIIVFGLKVS